MNVGELAQAVTLQESGRLTKVPGIGKKTAERLLLELRGKLGAALEGIAGAQRRSQRAAPMYCARCWRSLLGEGSGGDGAPAAGWHRRLRRHTAGAEVAGQGLTTGEGTA